MQAGLGLSDVERKQGERERSGGQRYAWLLSGRRGDAQCATCIAEPPKGNIPGVDLKTPLGLAGARARAEG